MSATNTQLQIVTAAVVEALEAFDPVDHGESFDIAEDDLNAGTFKVIVANRCLRVSVEILS